MGNLGWFMSKTQTATSSPPEGEPVGADLIEDVCTKKQRLLPVTDQALHSRYSLAKKSEDCSLVLNIGRTSQESSADVILRVTTMTTATNSGSMARDVGSGAAYVPVLS